MTGRRSISMSWCRSTNPADSSMPNWCVRELDGRPSRPPIFAGELSPAAIAAVKDA
jgi:hypothetical protein